MTYMYGQEVGERIESDRRYERRCAAWDAIRELDPETLDEVPGLRAVHDWLAPPVAQYGYSQMRNASMERDV